MELPVNLQIDSIDSFCVCHFKHKKHSPSSPSHFYIIIPIKPSSDFIICIITSQIVKKKDFYDRPNQKALKSLVSINKNIFDFLSKESIIDCNQTELIPKSKFSRIIDDKYGFTIKERNIPEALRLEIVEAIKNSPLVTPNIKKLIDAISCVKKS